MFFDSEKDVRNTIPYLSATEPIIDSTSFVFEPAFLSKEIFLIRASAIYLYVFTLEP